MKLVVKPSADELTIVSRRLLRVTAEDWKAPGEQFLRIRDSALDALLQAAEAAPNCLYVSRRVLLLLDCMLRVIDEPSLTSATAFSTLRF